MESTAVNVIAIIKVKPEFTEAARPIVEALVQATRKEEGNIRYDWFKDIKEEGTYIVMQTFASMEAFQLHASSEHMKINGTKLKEYASAPTEVRILKPEYVANK